MAIGSVIPAELIDIVQPSVTKVVALIDDSGLIVETVVVADLTDEEDPMVIAKYTWSPPQGLRVVQITAENVGIGWRWDGKEFSPPPTPPEPQPREIERSEESDQVRVI